MCHANMEKGWSGAEEESEVLRNSVFALYLGITLCDSTCRVKWCTNLKIQLRGWRDGSEVKSTDCSS